MNKGVLLANPLKPDGINLGLTAKTGPEAITELHAGLRTRSAVADSPLFLRELLARHRVGSNCLDQEIALPHARTAAVSQFVFAIGRSSAGIFFDEQHPSVRLVLLVGVPVDAVTEYLRWTAHFVRTLRSLSVREALLTTPNPEAFDALCFLSPRQSK